MGYSEWCYEGKIDHWFDSFEIFHPQYIIMPREYSNSYIPEESRFISVMTPPGFINKKRNKMLFQCNHPNVIFQWYFHIIDIEHWLL